MGDTGPRVFEPNEWVRVLLATVFGLLPRLATGCGKATDVDFDFATRTYSMKSLTMYARGQTMVPGSAVVYTCRDGTEEMYSRGSEAARAINALLRENGELHIAQFDRARGQFNRAEK